MPEKSKTFNENSPKVYIRTYGCQMNEYDSEVMTGLLKESGYHLTDNLDEADVILLNTCYVREKVKHKVYSKLGELRKLKEKKPGLILGISGCLVQKEPEEILRQAPYLDFILGTFNFFELPEVLKEISGNHRGESGVGESDESDRYNTRAEMPFTCLCQHGRQARRQVAQLSDERHTRVQIIRVRENGVIPENLPKLRKRRFTAFVPIMRGCDNFCSYCNVPYVRGREKSRSLKDILGEIEELSHQGCKEVTLLGQNVNSYGRGLKEKVDFADLLGLVNRIEGLSRIRFITSHPKDLSDKLIERIAELDKVCEHLHLPIQSGSNKILSRMNRGYTRQDYKCLVDKVRQAIPQISLTTDIIVGFPGETEEDFEDTLDLVKEIHFDGAFTFCYSPLAGTKATELEERVSCQLSKERLRKLILVQQEITLERNKSLIGQNLEVLVEGTSKKNPYELEGRTRGNKIVIFRGKKNLISNKNYFTEYIGELIQVKVTEAGCRALRGEGVTRRS